MEKEQFAQINTTIAVKEKEMISAQQFQKILLNPNKETIINLMQEKGYAIKVENFENLDLVEKALMSKLIVAYQWAFQESPSGEVVEVLALPYLYHNLKVLLKEKASKQDLSKLLIPIGKVSLSHLDHLVRTLSSDVLPDHLVNEVAAIWQEHLNYQDYRVLEVGCDLAYFKHLKRIAEQLDDQKIYQATSLIIQFYNLITVKRADALHKNQGFMKQLISDQGHLGLSTYLDLAEGKEVSTWFNQLNPDVFSLQFKEAQTALVNDKLTLPELERLVDQLLFSAFESGKYNADGPYQLLRYLLGLEFEIKNFRLLISALVNDLPIELVKERMRPIYE
ncbi:V-type ATPase subunit [Streptococcus parauberis]|uniref:V-type ATPase subunit n=2 Tax=Streptococcus parauberis TaxID=1348 RepID=A0A0E2UF99_9STRE|nr:V-type ATPase subunit [Streptococcus parauberis]AEF24926.1 Putative v-type sodium ATP synthase, subunit G [Streptococcus parauberis KCTC 11537]AUT05702.1 V-type sodium ATPase subunit [Streptococcus parauberis]EMG26213.1 V-type ATP synthase subunit C [Streptococcus parauberis KRS-02083]KYP16700.1 V-type sodium ATPase subunit C [Streptococcus parauberis]KYP18501.1 V-type sodium ATPase subunit C [Streptococcus parauberis]